MSCVLKLVYKNKGVDFPTNPIVLELEGIDVILGMSWFAWWNGVIQCAERTVSLTAPSGEEVEVIATIPSSFKGEINHLGGSMAEDIVHIS
jgi:hypothetical protein